MYEGRFKTIEDRQTALDARLDRLMLMMIGTLGTSLVGVVLQVVLTRH